MKHLVIALLVGLLPGLAVAGGVPMDDSPVAVYKSDNDFEDTKANLEDAVSERGMLVSGTLHVSDMLNRTGKDLGFPNNVYKKAESVEFCSALVSHRMTAEDASNLVICPFTIAVYIRSDEPGQVYVAYRKQYLAGDSDKVRDDILNMLDGIVQEAIE